MQDTERYLQSRYGFKNVDCTYDNGSYVYSITLNSVQASQFYSVCKSQKDMDNLIIKAEMNEQLNHGPSFDNTVGSASNNIIVITGLLPVIDRFLSYIFKIVG